MQEYSAGRGNDEMRTTGDFASANIEANRIEHVQCSGHRSAFGEFRRSEITEHRQKSSILVRETITLMLILGSILNCLEFRFSEKHSPESVLHFDDVMQLLNVYKTMTVFLLVAPPHKQVVERFGEYIANDENRLKRLIVCSRSPILIYQVRMRKHRMSVVYPLLSSSIVQPIENVWRF